MNPYEHFQQIAKNTLKPNRFSLRITYKGELICYDRPRWFSCDRETHRSGPPEGKQGGADSSQDSSDDESEAGSSGRVTTNRLRASLESGEPPPYRPQGLNDLSPTRLAPAPRPVSGPASVLEAGKSPRPLNPEFLATLKKRLNDTPDAVKFLDDLGLTPETVERFNLGLSKPYRKAGGGLQENALVYPVTGSTGIASKYGYCNIPGVTKEPANDDAWLAGPVLTYFADAIDQRQRVFVCGGSKDLWRIWQELSRTDYTDRLLLISSTQSSDYPDEWTDPRFWQRWEEVYFGFTGDRAVEDLPERIAKLVGREVKRVRVPEEYGKSGIDFWQNGGTLSEFELLLNRAVVVSQELKPGVDDLSVGRFSYEPVDINGAFHNGYLYYTVQTLTRELARPQVDAGGKPAQVVERLDTVVVRSDRSVHSAVWVAAPKGTRQQDRVLRLTDGTLITGEPQASKYATWSWPSIKAFLEGKSKARVLAEILRDILSYLKASVWLPYEEDYAVLALTVPITYTQAVFDSVPLLFLHGPAGSGKSQTGRAMARVSANAYVCGQTSAASIARFIDESRGFVVLDDLEAIGKKGGDFGDLVQALKQSYNKQTAIKLWTDVKTMHTRRINFFGVKMINNTRGAGAILKSRMLRVQTSKIPDHLREQFQESLPAEAGKLDALRDELHTWAFENVSVVDAEYRRLFPKNTDRAEEISAPLKVFSSLAADEQISRHLEIALSRQDPEGSDAEAPIRILHDALKGLIRGGYRQISITHVVLEMRRLLYESYGRSSAEEMPDWANPAWVGRQLRAYDLIDTDPAKLERVRVSGANLRVYPLREDVRAEVAGWFEGKGISVDSDPRKATDFCGECETCVYNNLGCEIMQKRLQARPRLIRRRSNYLP